MSRLGCRNILKAILKMKGLNSHCTRNIQTVSISCIKKYVCFKKIKETVYWYHSQNGKNFMPESLCWHRREKVFHTAVVRTAGEVYDSLKYAKAVNLQLYF